MFEEKPPEKHGLDQWKQALTSRRDDAAPSLQSGQSREHSTHSGMLKPLITDEVCYCKKGNGLTVNPCLFNTSEITTQKFIVSAPGFCS